MFRMGGCKYNIMKISLLIIFVSRLVCLTARSTNDTFILSSEFSKEILPGGPFRISAWVFARLFYMKETAYDHVWPDLKFNWRVVLGTIIGFVGGALGSVGGIGGGGIFVPMLTLIIGFDQKSSTALSKCMIMGASAASVWYNFRPTSSTIDYDLALIFQPLLVLGISIGVLFNLIFPNWLVTILLLVLFTGTSLRTFVNAISLWKKETIVKMINEHAKPKIIPSEAGLEKGLCDAVEPVEVHYSQPMSSKMNWKALAALLFVWISFLILQILKINSVTCGSAYWILNSLQVPVAASVFLTQAVSLYMRSKIIVQEDQECLLPKTEAQWTISRLVICSLAALIAGIVGGLLGLGGGFILGPLLLELRVPPEVASATATFIMLFSSSMSVIEYYFLHRFPVPFALYLFGVNVVAGFCGQYLIRKIVTFLGRTSIIIFLLSVVIFVSAICLGGYGIEDTIVKLESNEYMGFLSPCST